MLFEFETTIKDYDPKTPELYSKEEGFFKGNMFKSLYDEYKNYKPSKIITKSDREALLLHIMMLSFALNDLNLYLDVHPNDEGTYELFKKYAEAYDTCLKDYESKYQVLELCHDIYGEYTWLENPWPWEDNYV